MGEPVLYTFVATGAETVVGAFETIDAAAKRSGATTESVYRRVPAAARASGQQVQHEADKTAKATAQAAQKGAAAAAQAEAKRWREVERTSARIQREFAKEASAADRAAQASVKAQQRANNIRVKDAERTARSLGRLEFQIQEHAAAQAAKRRQSANRSLEGRGVSVLGTGGTIALGVAAAGTAIIGKAAGEALGTQGLANRISIRGRTPGQESVDPTAIRRELEATAIAHAGQTGGTVAGGVAAYQEHRGGDASKALEEARKFSDVFATFASSTGKEASEFGELGAVLAKKFDIKGVDEMGNAIAAVVAHAREAGVPLEEAVSHFDKLASSAQRFGLGKGAAGVNQLGALTSIATQGVGAHGADMAVNALLTKLTSEKTARKLKGDGVDVFKTDKSGGTNPIGDVLRDVFTKVGPADNMAEKRAQVQTALGGPKAFAAVEPLFRAYAEAFGKTTGTVAERTKAAGDAMTAAFDAASASSGSYSEAQQDAAQAETSASAQLEAAWQKLVSAVGEEVAPELAELAKSLADSPEAFKLVVDGLKALALVIQGFALTLRDLGLIKGPSHQDLAAKADKEAAKQQAKIDKMGLSNEVNKWTPAQVAEFSAAAAARSMAQRRAADERTKAREAGEAERFDDADEDAFAGAFGGKGGGGAAVPSAHGGVPFKPGAAVGESGLPDYAINPGQGGGGGDSGAADQKAAAAAHVEAAKAVTAAAEKLGNARPGGSIFGKPTATGGTG